MSPTEIDPTTPQPPSPPGIPHQPPKELPDETGEFPEEVEDEPGFGSDN